MHAFRLPTLCNRAPFVIFAMAAWVFASLVPTVAEPAPTGEAAIERARSAAERAETAAARAESAAEVAQSTPPPAATAETPAAPPSPAPAAATTPQPAPQADAPAAAPPPAVQAAAEPTAAEIDAIEDVKQPVIYLKAALDTLEKEIEGLKDNDEQLARRRVEIDALVGGGDLFLESLQPRYKAVSDQIAKLGPMPEAGQPPESNEIAAERARLNLLSAEIDGAIKATGLVQYRARELLGQVQQFRAALFTKELFRQSQSPLSPSTWISVADSLPVASNELGWIGWRWWRTAKDSTEWIAAIVALAIAAYAGLHYLRSRIFRARLSEYSEQRPDFFGRAATAGWVAALRALPAGAAAAILCFGLDNMGLLFLDSERLSVTLLPAFGVVIAVSALARAILQPRRPFWRIVDLGDRPAARLTTIVTWIGAVYAVDMILNEIMRVLAVPLPVRVAEAFLASIALGALLISIVATRFEPMVDTSRAPDGPALPGQDDADGSRPVALLSPYLLKVPLLLVAAFILLSSLFGYVSLGQFVADQVIVTGSVVILVLLLHLAIQAFTGQDLGNERALGRVVHKQLGLNERHTTFVTSVTAVVLNVLLALLAAPLVMVTWGFSLADTLAWFRTLVFGFEIGQFRISPVQIVAALALFAALLFVTRLLQRWLTLTVLKPPRFDSGIANSVEKTVGYTGFVIAALAALSYSGLDITNLAIVAGALSVGIGFGLQSIVNNFVSGLILLFERPIKVGDLVVVNGQWGRVRNISVRSTEIETVDRASLIVPNSELISQTVTNWTHRNPLARVTVRVSVGYESDPAQVRDLLYKIADACPHILQQPKPDVVFENFGNNGLDFVLYSVVGDISKSFAAQTDLRIRIFNAFKEAGIEIPFAQTDVRLRDVEDLKALIAGRITAEPSASEGSSPIPLRERRPQPT